MSLKPITLALAAEYATALEGRGGYAPVDVAVRDDQTALVTFGRDRLTFMTTARGMRCDMRSWAAEDATDTMLRNR